MSNQLKSRGFEQSSKILTGEEMVASLQRIQITPMTFSLYKVLLIVSVSQNTNHSSRLSEWEISLASFRPLKKDRIVSPFMVVLALLHHLNIHRKQETKILSV